MKPDQRPFPEERPVNPSLARTLDSLQSQRNEAWKARALRMERAQAEQNRACCLATPEANYLEIKGGLAFFMGAGHPLSQALAMGLEGSLEAAEIDRIECLLSQSGGVPQFELCPLTDPELFKELARRCYQVQEFQLSWFRELDGEPIKLRVPEGLEIRRTQEGRRFLQVVMGGFLECEPEAVPEDVLQSMLPSTLAEGTQLWGAFQGEELLGGGTLFIHENTAVLSGAGVPPRHRRKGIQSALIQARLAFAQSQGCDLVASGTAPGSSSQHNMERHGFRVAFPKLVLLKP